MFLLQKFQSSGVINGELKARREVSLLWYESPATVQSEVHTSPLSRGVVARADTNA